MFDHYSKHIRKTATFSNNNTSYDFIVDTGILVSLISQDVLHQVSPNAVLTNSDKVVLGITGHHFRYWEKLQCQFDIKTNAFQSHFSS